MAHHVRRNRTPRDRYGPLALPPCAYGLCEEAQDYHLPGSECSSKENPLCRLPYHLRRAADDSSAPSPFQVAKIATVYRWTWSRDAYPVPQYPARSRNHRLLTDTHVRAVPPGLFRTNRTTSARRRRYHLSSVVRPSRRKRYPLQRNVNRQFSAR